MAYGLRISTIYLGLWSCIALILLRYFNFRHVILSLWEFLLLQGQQTGTQLRIYWFFMMGSHPDYGLLQYLLFFGFENFVYPYYEYSLNRGFFFLELNANQCQYPSIPFIYSDLPKPIFISSLSFSVFHYNHQSENKAKSHFSTVSLIQQKKTFIEGFSLQIGLRNNFITNLFSSQMGQEKIRKFSLPILLNSQKIRINLETTTKALLSM